MPHRLSRRDCFVVCSRYTAIDYRAYAFPRRRRGTCSPSLRVICQSLPASSSQFPYSQALPSHLNFFRCLVFLPFLDRGLVLENCSTAQNLISGCEFNLDLYSVCCDGFRQRIGLVTPLYGFRKGSERDETLRSFSR